MSCPPEYTRLCRLIDESLRPFKITELSISITKETEKQLLSALSQVSRQIKLWINELYDCESDTEKIRKPCIKGENSVSWTSHSEDHHCLAKIISELVLLLAIHYQYVQHITGNILVAISQFVSISGCHWDEYVHLLGLCLELSMCKCLQSLELPTTLKVMNSDPSTSYVALNLALETSNWYTVAGIVSVLRNISKHLKKECDDQLSKVYLRRIVDCLSNIPWDLLNEIHPDLERNSLGSSGASFHSSSRKGDLMFLLRGNLVQFFCSLAAHGNSSKTGFGYNVNCEISKIVPKVLAWCLGKRGDCDKTSTSHYIRHKTLMLMIRLGYQIYMESPVLVSWLNIIHEYFHDLLLEPLTKAEADQDDCLEGSPFLMSFPVANKRISYRHLQRLAICFFLRCSLSLASQRDKIGECPICANLNLCSVFDQNWWPACCSRKQGCLELYKWLQTHLPPNIFMDNDLYSKRCTNFSLSFIRLYMHEDDILFKVLLQLLCIPLSEKRVCKGAKISQELEVNMLFLVSNLLNPIYLFHLFLAELLYDHQVLLDYLISKDTGASSAEYLLRCLRLVCDSWNIFVEFSLGEEVIIEAQHKKRKVLIDGKGDLFSAQHEGDMVPLSLEKQHKREQMCDSNQHRTTRLPFEDVAECLLSLKNSLVNLHKKNLFPYNPDVLLRRLTRFEELCLKQKRPTSETNKYVGP